MTEPTKRRPYYGEVIRLGDHTWADGTPHIATFRGMDIDMGIWVEWHADFAKDHPNLAGIYDGHLHRRLNEKNIYDMDGNLLEAQW